MKRKRVSPLNYAFAIGKIRVLEKFLIKQEVFRQAIETDLEGALRLFVEANLYSEAFLKIKDSKELEKILDQELSKLKKLIQELLQDKGLLSLLKIDELKKTQAIIKKFPNKFLNDYVMYIIDLHNIKTFLRLYFLKESPQNLSEQITCEGFIKKEEFLGLFSQELYAFLHRLEYVHKQATLINYAVYLA